MQHYLTVFAVVIGMLLFGIIAWIGLSIMLGIASTIIWNGIVVSFIPSFSMFSLPQFIVFWSVALFALFILREIRGYND